MRSARYLSAAAFCARVVTGLLEQAERRAREVRPAVPTARADFGDPAGADGVAVALVLGVTQSGEDDALRGGHDRSDASPGRGRSQPRRA